MFNALPGNIWMDGQFVPWSCASLHVMSHGLHYASSVYEGLRAYSGHIFKAQEHFERFKNSAQILGFSIPYAIEILMDAAQALVNQAQCEEIYIRPIAWCGSASMTVSNRTSDVHTAIGAWERKKPLDPQAYSKGIRMCLSPWRRPDPKTAPVQSKAAGLYMTSSISKANAERDGFDDALMLDYRGCIAEATSSNFFCIINGVLHTPDPHSFLNGITRLTCIELAQKLGMPLSCHKDLVLEDLSHAQEAFLTGTAIEILPIASIESQDKRWSFHPGPMTKQLMEAFFTLTRPNP